MAMVTKRGLKIQINQVISKTLHTVICGNSEVVQKNKTVNTIDKLLTSIHYISWINNEQFEYILMAICN